MRHRYEMNVLYSMNPGPDKIPLSRYQNPHYLTAMSKLVWYSPAGLFPVLISKMDV
jgi:hypothetical protein